VVRALLRPGAEAPYVKNDDVDDPRSRYAGFETVPVPVAVRVGRAQCSVGYLASCQPGEVIVLDRPLGAPFDLLSGDVELGRVEPVASSKAIALKLVAPAKEDDGTDR
jgi:flagellar motor switch/type III secretory pathway protein FliN